MNLVPYNIAALAETDVIGGGKNIMANAAVNIVSNTGGSAQIFADSAGLSLISLPTTTDSHGELIFYTTPGNYTLSIAGKSYDVVISDLMLTALSWADISNVKVSSSGQLLNLIKHTSSDFGGGQLISKAGSVADDGGTRKNSASSGLFFERIDLSKITVQMFGIVGSGDETAKISTIESSAYAYIDLCGLTVTITTPPYLLTKSYFNGKLVGSNQIIYKNEVITRPEYLDQTSGTKCHVLSWVGKKILWNGTSIPAYGGLGSYVYGQPMPGNSYPFLFGQAMGCSVKNYAWATSYAHFDKSENPFSGIPAKGLSMTEDDRAALLALHGAGSIYSDTVDPSGITKPSEMTADFRLKAQFVAGQIDVVVLDHNHNDQSQLPGTLTPESRTITAISKGATTSITVSAIGTIAVGDGVALDTIVGIPKLNYAAARVQTVVGNVVTINIDSSGFAGSFTSGTVKKLDRSTIYGSWEFLIYYIKNMSLRYNTGVVDIILNGAPSNFTNNTNTPEIYSISRYIKDVADKWNLSYFDVATALNIQAVDHIYYLPDLVHPSTLETRKAFAAHWVEWASGGKSLKKDDAYYLPSGAYSFAEQRAPLYSKFTNGFTTAQRYIGAASTLYTDAFASLASWTVTGPATGTVVAAPWGAGNAVRFPVTPANASGYIKRASTYVDGIDITFDFYMSSVALVTGSTIGIVNILTLGGASGTHYTLDLIVTASSATFRVSYYTSNGGVGFTSFLTVGTVVAGVKRTIQIQAIRASGSDTGAILLYLDGSTTPVTAPYITSDAAKSPDTDLLLGPSFNSTGATFDMYIGNVTSKTMGIKPIVQDWTAYTPTVTSGSGTLTSVSATGRYISNGVKCEGSAIITITTNGTGAAFISFTLPITSGANCRAASVGWNQGTGTTLAIEISGNAATGVVVQMAGGYPGASGYVLNVSFSYEI